MSRAEADKLPDELTGMIMQQIATAEQDEIAINPVLKKVLTQHGADYAPADLTRNVMAEVVPERQHVVLQPIISKKTWRIAGAVFVMLLIFLCVISPADQSGVAGNLGGSVVVHVNALPPVYVITLILGGMLLLADHFITDRGRLSGER